MTKEEVLQKYGEAYDFLKAKSIFDLRRYGFAVGVASPTVCRKGELIIKIIEIVSGEVKPHKKIKGPRVKAEPVVSEELAQFEKILKNQPLGEFEIKFTHGELKTLAQLIYIGQFVKRSCGESVDPSSAVQKIFRACEYSAAVTGAESGQNCFGNAEKCLRRFETMVFSQKLAQALAGKYMGE